MLREDADTDNVGSGTWANLKLNSSEFFQRFFENAKSIFVAFAEDSGIGCGELEADECEKFSFINAF